MLWYYIMPIAIRLLFLPLYIWVNDTSRVSIVSIIMGIFIIPVYLSVIYYKSIQHCNFKKSIEIFLVIIGLGLLDCAIQYFNWGVSSGKFFHPDSESLAIFGVITKIQVILVFIGGFVVNILKKILEK